MNIEEIMHSLYECKSNNVFLYERRRIMHSIYELRRNAFFMNLEEIMLCLDER